MIQSQVAPSTMLLDRGKLALLAAVLALTARAADITVVLEFDGPYSDRSIGEMKHEVEGILKDSGHTFDWRTRSQAAGQSYENLVLVKFKGKCVMEPVGYLYDERGPLAFTHSTDGALQPFSEVECDKVTTSVRGAMFGSDFARGDLLLGRALGRVLAHELVHILRNSKKHDPDGVEKPALSGAELIAPDLPHK